MMLKKKLQLIVAISLSIVCTRFVQARPCYNKRSGFSCQFTCHCYNANNPCALYNGQCIVCQAGYSALPLCQRQNVALGRTAKQSSTYRYNARNNVQWAVDGVSNDAKQFSLTDRKPSWWEVDLGSRRLINLIHLYTRQEYCYRGSTRYHCSEGNKGIKVYVSNDKQTDTTSPIVITGTLCYEHNGSSLEGVPGNPLIIKCTTPIDGRYVMVYQSKFVHMAIKEIEIFECTNYSFGDDCSNVCNCKTPSEVCNKVDGSCSSGCADGFFTTSCLRRCPENAFMNGTSCSGTCHCKSQDQCRDIDGECLDGLCEYGYGSPPKCQQVCPGHYGQNCVDDCHCLDNVNCHKVTGSCDPHNCEAGWRSDSGKTDCQLRCQDGKFGIKCAETCYCINNVNCHKVTGSCNNAGGCIAGRRSENGSENCQLECSEGKFGEGCRSDCHCQRQEDCNKESGSCQGAGGCADGWTNKHPNLNCQLQCGVTPYLRTYGAYCGKKCHCKGHSDCDSVDGSCGRPNNCASGWMNDDGRLDCQKPCPRGTFGENCGRMCHCNRRDDYCPPVSGSCHLYGCAPGWRNEQGKQDCQKKCEDYKFGLNCNATCNCRIEEICDKEIGKCQSGCKDGFQPESCYEPCEDKWFGPNCKHQCNCQDRNEVCAKSTGACLLSGCRKDYLPPSCLSKCPRGTFGNKCKEKCHCADVKNTCDGEGACLYGCADGYIGFNCQIPCSDRTFGRNCSFTCHCRNNGACRKEDGYCNDGLCAPGWMLNNCSIECDDKKYGDCKSKCNCKNESEACDKVSGACKSDCKSGYKGVPCSVIEIAQPKIDKATSNLVMGISLGAVIFILVVILAVGVVCHFRKMNSLRRELTSKSEEILEMKRGVEYENISPHDSSDAHHNNYEVRNITAPNYHTYSSITGNERINDGFEGGDKEGYYMPSVASPAEESAYSPLN